MKDLSAIYRSLELYDIEAIYVEEESLISRGLSQEDLVIPITLLKRSAIASTLNQFDCVLNG